MSSEYDKVSFGEGISLPNLPDDVDPNAVGFQSKTLPEAFCLREVKLTQDGLLVEEFEMESVPLEERPEIKDKGYENPEEDASPLEKLFGSFTKSESEMVDVEYHGDFKFYTKIEDEWYEYTARYTHGDLEEITRT